MLSTDEAEDWPEGEEPQDLDLGSAAEADSETDDEEPLDRARLDVYLGERGQIEDVLLDGASVYPTWFKLEFKGNGEMSAKVRGVRLSTRLGDRIQIHTGPRPPGGS